MRVGRVLTLVGLVFVLSLGVVANELVAQYTETPPVIDGLLDDPVWSAVPVVDNFVKINGGGKPSVKTELWVAWDWDYLYVAIRNHIPSAGRLRQTVTQDEGATWDDDETSVFLNPFLPAMNRMLQFSVNSLGTRNGLAYGGPNRPSLDHWEVGVEVKETYYTVEYRIAFDALGMWPEPQDEWGFNIGRNFTAGAELITWSPLVGSFVDPSTFGWMTFNK